MRYRRLLLAFIVVLLAIGGLGGHAAAKRTTFKQLILPIDCQFQIVANGLGTVVYLTPKECGQVPPPHNGGSGGHGNSGDHGNSNGSNGSSNANENGEVHIPVTPGNSSSGSSGTGATPPVTVGPTPHVIKLNTKPNALKKTGYIVTLSLGSSVSYLPRSQSSGNPHTLTITNVTATGVTVLMQPSGQFVEIPLGRTIYLDFDNNGNPAIEVHVLGAATEGHVKLSVRLVDNKNGNEAKSAGISPLLQVFVVVLVAFTLISLSNYSWKWWLERKEDQ